MNQKPPSLWWRFRCQGPATGRTDSQRIGWAESTPHRGQDWGSVMSRHVDLDGFWCSGTEATKWGVSAHLQAIAADFFFGRLTVAVKLAIPCFQLRGCYKSVKRWQVVEQVLAHEAGVRYALWIMKLKDVARCHVSIDFASRACSTLADHHWANVKSFLIGIGCTLRNGMKHVMYIHLPSTSFDYYLIQENGPSAGPEARYHFDLIVKERRLSASMNFNRSAV